MASTDMQTGNYTGNYWILGHEDFQICSEQGHKQDVKKVLRLKVQAMAIKKSNYV